MKKLIPKPLRKLIKRILKKTIKIWLLPLRLFYNKEWLSGKWFGEFSYIGYIWAFKGIPNRILKHYPWPCTGKNIISCPQNLIIHNSSLNNLQGFGCYIQNFAYKIYIGKDCYIAANCGLITINHDVYNLDRHKGGGDIVIGDKCWIGMNCIILPGVVLGEQTIVGAGSVVNKSFPDGGVVIAGNPAKVVKQL